MEKERFVQFAHAGESSGTVIQYPMMIRHVAKSARMNVAFGLGNQNPVRTIAT
jgi:hypothetical protein